MHFFRRLFVAVLALNAGFALATTVPEFSLQELLTHSQRIVHGRVTRTWTAWDAIHRYIWTHYAVQSSETLKGTAEKNMVVSEPGGTLDGITMTVPDVPTYRIGEEVVLFLHRTPIGYWRVFGYLQGKFSVQQIASRTVVTSASPHPSVRRVNGTTLEQFRAQILRMVQEDAHAH